MNLLYVIYKFVINIVINSLGGFSVKNHTKFFRIQSLTWNQFLVFIKIKQYKRNNKRMQSASTAGRENKLKETETYRELKAMQNDHCIL